MVTTRSQEAHQTSPGSAETPPPVGTPRRSNRNRGGSPRSGRNVSPTPIEDTIELNPDKYRLGPASPSAASDHSVKEKLKKASINPGGSSQRSIDSGMRKSPGAEDDDGEDESMGSSPQGSGGSSPTGRKRTYEDSNEGSQEENDTKERLANSPPPRKREQLDNVGNVLENAKDVLESGIGKVLDSSQRLANLTQDASEPRSAANGQSTREHGEDTAMVSGEDSTDPQAALERKRKASPGGENNNKDEKGRAEGNKRLNTTAGSSEETDDHHIEDAPPESSNDSKAKDATEKDDAENSVDESKEAVDDNKETKVTTAAAGNITDDDSSKTDSKLESKISPQSGFANTSEASPFAALGSSSTNSAFAASKFGQLAGSTVSQFGTSSQGSSPSPFGTAGQSSSASPFATAGQGPSAFGTSNPSSTASGFGSLGGGTTTSIFNSSPFGTAALGSKNIFASSAPKPLAPVPVVPLGAAPPKAFGAADSDDEDSDDENDDEKEKEKEPEQPTYREDGTKVVAGEENEDVLKQARVKMYQMEGKSWKERGTGTLKLLVEKEQDEESGEAAAADDAQGEHHKHQKARIVMRQEGVGKVLLNSRVFTGMLGEEPKDQWLKIMTVDEGGKNTLALLKFINVNFSKEIYQLLKGLITEAS